MYRNFRREGSNSNREDGKRQYYPIYADLDSGAIRIPKMEWDDFKEEWIVKEKPLKNEITIYPINDDGVEKNWRWSEANVTKDYTQFLAKIPRRGLPQVYYKYRPNMEGFTPLTFWADAKYSATEHGTKALKDLFGISKFSYPKSIYAVEDCLTIMGLDVNGIALDYFPGSGTTFQAVMALNNRDQGRRKCILIEQGLYVFSVILPRIKKIAYSFDWEEGKPIGDSMNGLGVFLKYQRLEQYEEALENIAFTVPQKTAQQALEFKDYIPKYFLEFETRDSRTLVNTEEMADPWDYQLNVWDGYTYDTQQAVDLVETFNYLIGLHMHKCITREVAGRRYQFVYGCNNCNKQILVVWRNVKDFDLAAFEVDGKFLRDELKGWTYDVLYINGQAHIEGYQPIEEIFKNKMIP